MEKKELLLKASKCRLIACITVFFYFHMILGNPLSWAAGFEDSVTSGKNTGTSMVDIYQPSKLNQTLQDKGLGGTEAIIPQGDAAKQQQDAQKQYYTNPSTMSGGNETDAAKFVTDTSNTRIKIDLTSDATFSYKCLQREQATNKCLRWSTSEDVMQNTYTDCETIITPVYDADAEYKTCSGTNKAYEKSCSSTTYANIITETIYEPCSSFTPDNIPGQIYAQCKDYYRWYKKFAGTGTFNDDCFCLYHGELSCFSQNVFTAGEPPPGATFFATSIENPRNQEDADGWDTCTEDLYNWYYIYDHSTVERISLMEDTTCPSQEALLANECAVKSLIMCDATGMYCFNSIAEYAETGVIPEFDENIEVFAGEITGTCLNNCNLEINPEKHILDCVGTKSTCTGICPANSKPAAVLPPYYVKTGMRTTWVDNDVSACAITEECFYEPFSGTNICWPVSGLNNEVALNQFDYYINGFTCKAVSGSVDNYTICLKYNDMLVIDSHSIGNPLTTEPVREDWTSSNTYTGWSGGVYSFPGTSQFSIRGGPDVRPYRNVWKMQTELSCISKTDDCADLKAQGCIYDSTTCIDEFCTERTFNYICGGSGQVKEYQKAYICAGQMRCMGTDCGEIIKVKSGDFGEAAAAGEILNMLRIDSNHGKIFPGDRYECQESPKNCCDDAVGGVSIGEYIQAGKTLFDVGAAAAAEFAPTFYNAVTTTTAELASYLPSIGQELVTKGVTTMVQETAKQVATEVLTTAMTEVGGMAAGAAADAAMAVVGAICTVLSVLAILYAIYVILSFLYKIMFSCDEEDMATSVKLTLKLCHLVGKVDATALGMKLKKRNVYCCFNSILAKLIHEQGRPQINRGWGTPDYPDCGGLEFGEMEQMDLSSMDFSEYMDYVKVKTTKPTPEQEAALIQKATQSAEDLKNRQ